MTPRERFLAAVHGDKVDRIPTTAWVHFLSDHLTGEETARLHERFLKTYRWDFAKVMSDYRYPMPAGVRSLEDPASIPTRTSRATSAATSCPSCGSTRWKPCARSRRSACLSATTSAN